MSDYILGADAVLDLEDIWDYIASDSIEAADRWIEKPFDAFEAIARMPGIGHKREELNRHLRAIRSPTRRFPPSVMTMSGVML